MIVKNPNNVKPLCVIIDKINEYIEESNGNIYLVLVSTDESKDILKMYAKWWTKIKDRIRSISNNSDNYEEKYMKIFFFSFFFFFSEIRFMQG